MNLHNSAEEGKVQRGLHSFSSFFKQRTCIVFTGALRHCEVTITG